MNKLRTTIVIAILCVLLAPAAMARYYDTLDPKTGSKQTVSTGFGHYYGSKTATTNHAGTTQVKRGERLYQMVQAKLAVKAARQHHNPFRYTSAVTKPVAAPNIPAPAPAAA